MKYLIKAFSILISVLLFWLLIKAVSTQPGPYRTNSEHDDCSEVDCSKSISILEVYNNYDIGFIEFSERGNQIDRDGTDKIFNRIQEFSKTKEGISVVVFIHGWKHNSASDDSNVKSFRAAIRSFSKLSNRQVFGIYIGWRGKSLLSIPLIEELTYWDRKAVAEEIGSGGITEVISMLSNLLVEENPELASSGEQFKNSLIMIGHSFGGAILMSAINDVFIHHLTRSRITTSKNSASFHASCNEIGKIADAILLLNPAIEANKAFLLSDILSDCHAIRNPHSRIHVVSSENDMATHKYFPLGQSLGVNLFWEELDINRIVDGSRIIYSESQLDRITIGNYPPYISSYISLDKASNNWNFTSQKHDKARNINSYFKVTQTDENFIKDHNDIFNCNVFYLTFAEMMYGQVQQRRHRKYRHSSNEWSNLKDLQFCNVDSFEYIKCFEALSKSNICVDEN